MKKNIQMKVGENIREIRKTKNISQEELGFMIGMAKGDISNIETGKRNVTLDTIERIANALNCKVDILIKPK